MGALRGHVIGERGWNLLACQGFPDQRLQIIGNGTFALVRSPDIPEAVGSAFVADAADNRLLGKRIAEYHIGIGDFNLLLPCVPGNVHHRTVLELNVLDPLAEDQIVDLHISGFVAAENKTRSIGTDSTDIGSVARLDKAFPVDPGSVELAGVHGIPIPFHEMTPV